MEATIKGRLTGDATLIALLTGGIYDSADLPGNKLSLEYLRAEGLLGEFGEVPPIAVITWGTESPEDRYRAELHTCHIWLYEQDGNSVINQAAHRIKSLLVRWHPPSTATSSIMDIASGGGIREFIDPDLNNANGRLLRFSIKALRKV